MFLHSSLCSGFRATTFFSGILSSKDEDIGHPFGLATSHV